MRKAVADLHAKGQNSRALEHESHGGAEPGGQNQVGVQHQSGGCNLARIAPLGEEE